MIEIIKEGNFEHVCLVHHLFYHCERGCSGKEGLEQKKLFDFCRKRIKFNWETWTDLRKGFFLERLERIWGNLIERITFLSFILSPFFFLLSSFYPLLLLLPSPNHLNSFLLYPFSSFSLPFHLSTIPSSSFSISVSFFHLFFFEIFFKTQLRSLTRI